MPRLQAARGAALNLAADGTPDDSTQPSRPRGRVGVVVGVAACVWALDQATKWWAVRTLADQPPVEVLGSWLRLTYVRNPGAAFGMGTGMTLVFTLIAVVVVAAIVRLAPQLGSTAWAVALGGVLGGALGNLTDRILRSPGPLRGHVVDWIQLPHWPVFNVADSAIVCSAVLMVVLSLAGVGYDGSRVTR